MKRKAIIYILLGLVVIIWWVLYYSHYKEKKAIEEQAKYYSVDEKWEFKKTESLTKEQKLEQLKRRMNFRSIIRKGDFYSIKNMKETALQYYLNAYKKLSHDHVIEKKIWDTYFEMKNFQKAYSYYNKIPIWELDNKSKDKMLKTLLYTWNKNMRDEFNKVSAPREMKEYYDKVLVCYTWIKNCIEEFKKYTGTWEKIVSIKNDMMNFEKIQNADPNSKYAILAWDFLKNKDYLAAAVIAEETIKKRMNYWTVIQIAWFAWFELWDYKKSNDFLQRYYAIDPKNVNVTYLLWIINFYLENYISSNLYFNAAVLNWYTPKNELQKRLAYNYYILWDKKNMLKVFRYILDEDDVTQDDYAVALFTSIEENESSKAMLWANKWIQKFSQSDMLYWFRWWLYRLRWEDDKAQQDFNTSLQINPRSAISLYNYWVLAFEKNDYTKAKEFFNATVEVDENGTFWDEAAYKLKLIKEKEDAILQSQSWSTDSWSVNNQ